MLSSYNLFIVADTICVEFDIMSAEFGRTVVEKAWGIREGVITRRKRFEQACEDFLEMGFSFLQNKRRERFLGSFLSW